MDEYKPLIAGRAAAAALKAAVTKFDVAEKARLKSKVGRCRLVLSSPR